VECLFEDKLHLIYSVVELIEELASDLSDGLSVFINIYRLPSHYHERIHQTYAVLQYLWVLVIPLEHSRHMLIGELECY